MITLAYVTSFGSQTIHNGTTHHNASGIILVASKARIRAIELPNGALFDADTTDAAAVVPAPFKTRVQLNYSTTALALAEVATIMGLVGTRATLTATKITSGTVTAAARLEQVQYIGKSPTDTAVKRPLLELSFVPMGVFS